MITAQFVDDESLQRSSISWDTCSRLGMRVELSNKKIDRGGLKRIFRNEEGRLCLWNCDGLDNFLIELKPSEESALRSFLHR
jgi:hypothetical protein